MNDRIYLWHLETLDGCFGLIDGSQVPCQNAIEFTYSGPHHEARDEDHE